MSDLGVLFSKLSGLLDSIIIGFGELSNELVDLSLKSSDGSFVFLGLEFELSVVSKILFELDDGLTESFVFGGNDLVLFFQTSIFETELLELVVGFSELGSEIVEFLIELAVLLRLLDLFVVHLTHQFFDSSD